jgi:hypothetical protein
MSLGPKLTSDSGLTTRDMIDSMKFGTYIFFAFFSGAGGVFVWFLCPGEFFLRPILRGRRVLTMYTETKNRTLEELDVFFGGSLESIAVKDKERMENIYERLGLSGVQTVQELGDRKLSTAHVEEDRTEKA